MSGLIDRLQDRTATPNERPRVIEMDEEDADDVLDALSSGTARRAVRSLFEEPATPSELADRLDTSIQNVHYHLTNLQAVELVEPIETVYSEKGNEMSIYAPANDPLVFVGDRSRVPAVTRSVTQVVGGLAILVGASLLVQWGAERLLGGGDVIGGAAAPAEWGPPGADAGADAAPYLFDLLQPGTLFFVGCLVVAAAVAWRLGR